MRYGIDRRLDREIYFFTLLNNEFYEDLGNYVPKSQELISAVKLCLTDGWKAIHKGIWYQVTPPDHQMPLQGFKIHISTDPPDAPRMVEAVVPILVDFKAAFKTAVDNYILSALCSKNWARGSSGKFMTIYPSSEEQFLAILNTLGEKTAEMKGPYILSDRPFKGSKTIFYRYGSFVSQSRLEIYGEKTPVLRAPDGSLITDQRAPYFQLPQWMKDPFEAAPPHQGEILLNKRYQIIAALVFSNAGGVYRAWDTHSGETVIIKEARPSVVETDLLGSDAASNLKKEYAILKRLENTGFTPRPIDFFQEWEHTYLVEEFIDGFILPFYASSEETSIVLSPKITRERILDFCDRFRILARNLIYAVQAFHEQGVIAGDLSPANVIVDPDTLALAIIDFESGCLVDDISPRYSRSYTPGYGSTNRVQGHTPVFEDDYFSAARILHSLVLTVQNLFDLCPEAEGRFLHDVSVTIGLPSEMEEVVSALKEGNLEHALTLLSRKWVVKEPAMPGMANSDRISLRSSVISVVEGITEYILASGDESRKDRLWPADYRLFMTNPLSLSYGACGVALYLKQATGVIPSRVAEWIANAEVNATQYAPGLYIGSAGVAFTCLEMGLRTKAETALLCALNSPLLDACPDIFYGQSGVARAALHFWERTGQAEYLEHAKSLADRVIATGIRDANGRRWINFDGEVYYGYPHGSAGIGLFLLRLHSVTGDVKYLQAAKEALEYEIQGRVEREGSIGWKRAETDPVLWPYWRFGSAGVGSVMIRFFDELQDERYKDLSVKAAQYCVAKYTIFPSQFDGLAGMGEFFLDLFHFMNDEYFLDQAWNIAAKILLFQIRKPEGIAFPGHQLLRITNDFGTGSAGIGSFLLRLLNGGSRLLYETTAMEVLPDQVEVTA